MNHEDTRTQRAHEDNFVLLCAFESWWFKFKLTYYHILNQRPNHLFCIFIFLKKILYAATI